MKNSDRIVGIALVLSAGFIAGLLSGEKKTEREYVSFSNCSRPHLVALTQNYGE
jgi:hypothetical protein